MSQQEILQGRDAKVLSEGVYVYTMQSMPRPKAKGPTDNFQFRLKPEEFEIWESLWKKAKALNNYLSKSDFNRMLIGLSDDERYVTAQDRNRFYAVGKGKPELVGVAPPGRARMRQVPTSQIKKERAR